MTERLFDADSHMARFTARVLSCRRAGEFYRVTLDRTAFFPEGGGQGADTGTLGAALVTDAREEDGEIIHITRTPLEEGCEVTGAIDWDKRFRRMQNHSGEHIISGIVWRDYGLKNVGFHIGSDDVTIDFDAALERDALLAVERAANLAVSENVPVTAAYPAPEELASMNYRSKIDLLQNVRIVTVEGYDSSACCAPHVHRTGEIGIIKILDSVRYKGGVRIHIRCGFDALDDYNVKYENICAIAVALSVKQKDAAAAVAKLTGSLCELRQEIASLQRELVALKLAALPGGPGDLLIFDPSLGMDEARALAQGAAKIRAGVCAVFTGNEGGYRYAAAAVLSDLRALSREISSALSGRGGGSADAIQGSASCSAREVREFFVSRGFDVL